MKQYMNNNIPNWEFDSNTYVPDDIDLISSKTLIRVKIPINKTVQTIISQFVNVSWVTGTWLYNEVWGMLLSGQSWKKQKWVWVKIQNQSYPVTIGEETWSVTVPTASHQFGDWIAPNASIEFINGDLFLRNKWNNSWTVQLILLLK